MRKLFFIFQFYTITVARVFFNFLGNGISCVICGKKCFTIPLCKNCQSTWFSNEKIFNINRCEKCGKELISTENSCMQCRDTKVLIHTDSVFPIFSYRLWNKELLFLWKIQGIRSFSKYFASLFYKVIKEKKYDFVIPVPPRPGKIKENGWDQIDEVCKFLKYFYKINILNLLERVSTQQQKKLDREGRLESINSAYRLKDKLLLEKELKGLDSFEKLKICIIDDVCTTGSTIESCSKLLKKIGFQKVEAVTLFTVD